MRAVPGAAVLAIPLLAAVRATAGAAVLAIRSGGAADLAPSGDHWRPLPLLAAVSWSLLNVIQ